MYDILVTVNAFFLHSSDFYLTLVLLGQAYNSSTWEAKDEKSKFKASKGYTVFQVSLC